MKKYDEDISVVFKNLTVDEFRDLASSYGYHDEGARFVASAAFDNILIDVENAMSTDHLVEDDFSLAILHDDELDDDTANNIYDLCMLVERAQKGHIINV